jgi:hypothetical protein
MFYDSIWQNAVAVAALTTIAVIVLYLISMK